MAGFHEGKGAEFADQACAFGYRNEFHRADGPQFGVVETEQRFESHQLARRGLKERLVVEGEKICRKSFQQGCMNITATARGKGKGGVEEGIAGTAAIGGGLVGEAGILHEAFGCMLCAG